VSIRWIPFPRTGTSVEAGKWLCTVKTGHTLSVEILELDSASWLGSGDWFRHGGEKLSRREKVVAISYLPDPATVGEDR
jgi:hypothetical protein